MSPYQEDEIVRISDSVLNHNADRRYFRIKYNSELSDSGQRIPLPFIPMFKPNVIWRVWHFIKREVISLKNV